LIYTHSKFVEKHLAIKPIINKLTQDRFQINQKLII